MPEHYLPIRPNRDSALTLREKRALFVRVRALQGAERAFVEIEELARQVFDHVVLHRCDPPAFSA